MATIDDIREAELLAADAIGDVIEHWGFRKALGRVWTLLYLAGEALPAAELCERLQMSSGAMSMALNELREWGVVQRVWKPGDRKEYFEAETDFWKMISRVVHDRERSLARSVHERLDRAVGILRSVPPTPEVKGSIERVRRLLSFATMALTVIDSFIASRRADFSEFGNLLQFARKAVRPAGGRKG